MRALLVAGSGFVLAVFLAPALAPDVGAEATPAAVLPIAFFAAGAVGHVLRPWHPIAGLLAWFGVLHLVAVVSSGAAYELRGAPAVALVLGAAAVAAYAIGFVVLLDLLARYPDGRNPWAGSRRAVRAAYGAAMLLAAVNVLGSLAIPQVLGLSGMPSNPLFVPPLASASEAAAGIAIAPLIGFVLLVARYRVAPETDRRQMRWPIVTALLVVAGIVLTGILESLVGPAIQTGLFLALGVALPGSLLIGLLRHSEESERLAVVEESRARIAEAEERERRRIERDLHDGAQQQLIALLARVELARQQVTDAAARAELDAVAEGIRDIHRELRELARGIHPAILTDRGLPEAILSAASRMPIDVDVEIASDLATARHAPAIEGAAYLFVLEALTNVAKHADAQAARVRLASDGATIEVAVEDAGIGFDPADATEGAGMTNMRDRLAAVGGQLLVESRRGGGTILRGLLPANRPDGA